MNADPDAQLRLLEVQAADSTVAQLTYRRSSLPELAAIASRDERIASLDLESVELRTRLSDVAGDQRRLENDVDTVRSRATRDEQRLASGGLPSKELERIQHEITSLARRQSTLEDDLLDVMEQRESLDAELAGITATRTALDDERTTLVQSRDEAFAEIDGAITEQRGARTRVAAGVPADLLDLYDKVRAAHGGVGAALLTHRRCEGCHIELAGNELAEVRTAPPERVMRCENCRRILVRSADSGL